MNPAGLSNFRKRFCLFLLGAAFLLTLLFLVAEIRLVRIPAQRDYGEGHVWWLSKQILNTAQAYKPVDTLPYVAYPYTPLYMLAARLAYFVFRDPLTAGRSLSLLCTLGIGVALGLTVALSFPPRTPWLVRAASGAFAGVLPLMLDSVAGWGSLMRVDMLALLLMQAGLGIYITLGKQERWQYAAAFLFVLALFTKQTMLSAPLACLTFGFFADRKRTLRAGALAVAVALAGAWFLNSVTHGGFLTNILDYNINPFSWETARTIVYQHMRECLPWLAISIAAFLGVWNIARMRRLGWQRFLAVRSANPYSRAVLVAGLNSAFAMISMVSIGKSGANYNHLLAWDISICLLCGLFMLRMLAVWNRSGSIGRTTSIACAALLVGLLLPSMTLLSGLQPSGVPGLAQVEAKIVQRIRQTPGPVFSENLTLLLQAGKPVEVEPATVTLLTVSGGWDERPYVQLFDDRYFSLLVTNDIHAADRYSSAVASAIQRSYIREQQIGEYSIYRPIPRIAPAK
jgi:hypothetical protein